MNKIPLLYLLKYTIRKYLLNWCQTVCQKTSSWVQNCFGFNELLLLKFCTSYVCMNIACVLLWEGLLFWLSLTTNQHSHDFVFLNLFQYFSIIFVIVRIFIAFVRAKYTMAKGAPNKSLSYWELSWRTFMHHHNKYVIEGKKITNK